MTAEDTKNSPETVQRTTKGQEAQAKGKLAKSTVRYWEGKVAKREYQWNGKPKEIPDWQIRLAHAGKQRWFNLGTTNRSAAGARAKERYEFLRANGWGATLAKYGPRDNSPEPVNAATVGAYLALVEAKTTLEPVTRAIYFRKLRTALAGMFGIEGGKNKYNYRTGGRLDWLARIDGIRLEQITNDRIDAWRVKEVKRAQAKGGDATERTKRTISSLIRAGKALFRGEVAKVVGVPLPNPAPFVTASNEKITLPKYESNKKTPFGALDAAAERELRDSASPIDSEAYKAFVLSLWSGLRRREIDDLKWESFDWNNNTVAVDSDRLKTENSQRTVDVDPALMLWFKECKAKSQSEFVIDSERKAKHVTTYYRYRCEKVFERLLEWLRKKGISANKPLHTMRKEFGSNCIAAHGVYVAKEQLGHSKIETTVNSYAEKRAFKPLVRSELIPATLEQQAAKI